MNTLHILPADVQNTVHIRLEEGGSVVVRNGFHFSFIQLKGGLQECLTVSSRAGVSNFRIGGKLFFDLFHRFNGCFNGGSFISRIESIKEFSFFGD